MACIYIYAYKRRLFAQTQTPNGVSVLVRLARKKVEQQQCSSLVSLSLRLRLRLRCIDTNYCKELRVENHRATKSRTKENDQHISNL